MPLETTGITHPARLFLKMLLKAHRAQVVLSLSLLCTLGFLNGAGILLLVPLLESAGVTDNSIRSNRITTVATDCFEALGLPPSIPNILIVFLAFAGLQAFLQRLNHVLNSQLQQDFTEWIRNSQYEALIRSNWLFHARARASDFKHSLVGDINRVSRGSFALLRLASNLITGGVHITLALLISPYMTVATIGSLLVYWPFLGRLNRLSREAGSSVSKESKEFFARTSDQLSSMKELKTLGAESGQLELFYRLTASINSAHMKFARAHAGTMMTYNFGAAVLLSLLLVIAIEVLKLPPGELAVLALIFGRLMPRIREAHGNYQQVLNSLPALTATMELNARCEAAREPEEPQSSRPVTLAQDISLRDVSFRYDQESDVWALRNVNMTIPVRTTTAIVGKSGAGKSTLADILMGLLVPEDGTIGIDGQSLDSSSLHQWRRIVGYVPQETVLLHDTIRANLLWAQPTASTADVEAALVMAAADEFVESMPSGLDTVIGDRGTRLSGGERQRIALARALLRNPGVLILDEATSSLDAENQSRILDAIYKLKGKLTIIVIAHRLSTVRNADQIILLEEGQIAESGTWDELAEIVDGRFRSLIHADEAASKSSQVAEQL